MYWARNKRHPLRQCESIVPPPSILTVNIIFTIQHYLRSYSVPWLTDTATAASHCHPDSLEPTTMAACTMYATN